MKIAYFRVWYMAHDRIEWQFHALPVSSYAARTPSECHWIVPGTVSP
jgi:hypothetical protein